jgi:DNA-binding PadR family transcriptional regulator
MAERSKRDEIPPGTLYLLILRTLSRGDEMHGYEIASAIQRISDDVLQVEEGSLYPALQRMLLKGGGRRMGRDSRQSAGALLSTHGGRAQTARS